MVGMLRIPNCAATACSSSVLSLTSRAADASRAAASANAGAIILQGPHHGAQKSTTTGRSLRVTCFLKAAPLKSGGWASKSGWRHWPHRGSSVSRPVGTRFTAWQRGQTMCFDWLTNGATRRGSTSCRCGHRRVNQGALNGLPVASGDAAAKGNDAVPQFLLEPEWPNSLDPREPPAEHDTGTTCCCSQQHRGERTHC